MTDLRESLGWLIGSIATAVAMIIGWFISSGVVINLLFLLVGSGITYFVQTRTQKRAWKREYSIKIAETVYGELYREVRSILSSLEPKRPIQISFEKWAEFQRDHRYFMVDEKFREKLDRFLVKVREYSLAVYRLRTQILPKIVSEEAAKVFLTSVKAEEIVLEIKYREGYRIFSTTPFLIECLISLTHPKDYALENNPEREITEFQIRFGQVPAGSKVYSKFDEFWEACLKRMEDDKSYQYIIEETTGLSEEAEYVKKELTKRIQEPWRI